jgi:tRNA(Ile2) C34 agmatinyltransferase TiaS
VINAIASGPDTDVVMEPERPYVRALEDVMLMIKVLRLSSCPVCGGTLETGASGLRTCKECGATTEQGAIEPVRGRLKFHPVVPDRNRRVLQHIATQLERLKRLAKAAEGQNPT